MIHELKILPQYFKEVVNRNKTFEIRKNDRGFKVGDTILLKEYKTMPLGLEGSYTGNEITKEISYILYKSPCGLEEGYCILGLKQDGIKLKNINLTGISKYEQLKKTKEELQELIGALAEDEYYSNVDDKDKKEIKDHIISEFWDVVQAHLGLLEKHGIPADEVTEGYPKHIEKLEKRGNKPRKKLCSKCVNSKPYKLNDNYFICNGNVKNKDIEYAKECKSYEEQEE